MDAAGPTIYSVLSWGENGCLADTTVRPNVCMDVVVAAAWIEQNPR